MSKKIVRDRDSYIKNWTAAITGSFVLVSAQAAQANEHRAAFREFRDNNPSLERRELRNAFRQQMGGSIKTHNAPALIPSVNGINALPDLSSNRQARIEARADRLEVRNNAIKNVSRQLNDNGLNRNIRAGLDLDLTSQLRNITLGAKLFANTASVDIQVGGQTKTLIAGSKVTAAEYVAAKQVLAGLAQKVDINGSGAATGGEVDLSAITGRGDVMRASALTVPVNVTTLGDFSRGSEFRLLGGLTNDGTIHAFDSDGNGRGGTLRAQDILNNAGGVISSEVDLNLRADRSLTNYGSITSEGNLSITSASVTNRGTVSSAKDVNLSSPTGAMRVDGAGGTISAANNINVNVNADSILAGGNYLSNNLNLNAGAGTISANLGNVTGVVNSTGYAVHFNSATETLNLGEINLIDPTFYNIGNINFTGDVNVSGNALTVIASGNITESVVGSFTISTQGVGVAGGALTLIAGANITSADQPGSPTVGAGAPAQVTFNQGSIGGGSILLNDVQMLTGGDTDTNGGDVLLAAFAGTNGGSGQVNLANGVPTVTSNIDASGDGLGTNGSVRIFASRGINLGEGSINASGGTAALSTGIVQIISAQPTSAGPVTYNADGTLATGGLFASSILSNATVTVGDITSSGFIQVAAGGNLSTGDLTTTGTGSISLWAGINPNTFGVVNNAASFTTNGSITTSGTAGNIQISTANDFILSDGDSISAVGDVSIFVGITTPAAPGGANFTQNGSVSAGNHIVVGVGNNYVLGNDGADSLAAIGNATITVGTQSPTGSLTQNAAIIAGDTGTSDGSVVLNIAGDYTGATVDADIRAGQGDVSYTGSVTLGAQNVSNVSGAEIVGNDVFLTSNSDNGGDFDLAGTINANNAVTPSLLVINQNGSVTTNISDDDFGGFFADRVNISNTTTGGDIEFLNNLTQQFDFNDVTVNALGDITLVEPSAAGDGNINFVNSSLAGGTFTVLVDGNVTTDAFGLIGGQAGDILSTNGNIGTDAANPLHTDFDEVRIRALGTPTVTSGNAWITGLNGVNFAGQDSSTTRDLSVVAFAGDITTDGVTVLVGRAANLESQAGNIGNGILDPFVIDVGNGAGQGVTANASGDVALYDASDAAINGNSSSTAGFFSFVSDAILDVNQNVTAGTDIILDGSSALNIGAVNVTADDDVFLIGNTMSANVASEILGDQLVVDTNGTVELNTRVNEITTQNGNGIVTINEFDGINVGTQSVTDLAVFASLGVGGDIFTTDDISVANLSLFNAGGNVFINNTVTASSSATIDVTGIGGGGIAGTGTLVSPDSTLVSDTGDIVLDVDGVAGGDTFVIAQAGGGGNVDLAYLGTGTMTLGNSAGNLNYIVTTTTPTGEIAINDDIDGTGQLNLTTNVLRFENDAVVAFDSAIVQSLDGSGLILDGGDITNGGTFVTTEGGAGVSLIATDGDFVALQKTNFVGGDVFVTLENNDGINAFDVSAAGANLNGDGQLFPPGNNITITAALIVGNSLNNLTNFNDMIVIGNTIHNSNGDVILPGNLIFSGTNMAIIASGNVSAVLGTTTIDLSSAVGNGGSLTILAGFDNFPATVGQETTGSAVTITGLNAVGGSVDLTGVNIITSSTAGDAGDVTVIAHGGTGIGTGSVILGDITATSTIGAGGDVAIAGSSGVSVGNVQTFGVTAGGDVALGVGSIGIVGTPVYTNGVLSGGFFVPSALTAGDLNVTSINAGNGDIALAGARDAGNVLNVGYMQGDNLEVFMGAGVAVVASDINEVQVDATTAGGGSFTINEGGSINVDQVDGSDLDFTVNAFGTINLIGDISVGTGAVGLSAQDITTATNEKISADSLNLDVQGTATVNTAVNSMTSTTGTGSINIFEDDGIDLGAQSASSLIVSASQVAAGAVNTVSDFTVDFLTIENQDGNININNAITVNSNATLDAAGGPGAVGGSGTLSAPFVNLFADAGGINLTVNGLAGADTTISAQAFGGDVDVTYSGTGTATLVSSNNNDNYSITANNGSIEIEGFIAGTGDMTLTSDDISFADSGAYSVTFNEITLNSITDLTVSGGANGGTFNSTVGVNFNATNGDLTTNDLLNFNGGDVFATLVNNNGINSFVNNGTLNGDGTMDGDPNANSLTITAANITPGTITNFNNVFFLQGNTIINTAGDVVLPANLIFQGQNLAIIASGNITATGATLIDLSSNTGNGGDLFVIAGYDATGVGPGQQQTQNPVTVTGVSSTGGNVNLAGVDIITSSTAVGGSAGNVTIIAGSTDGAANEGNIVVGSITASGDVDGGFVAVAGYNNVAVGAINTIGANGNDGFVILGSGSLVLDGTMVFTNGSLTSGGFLPGALSGGNITYGIINAGTGDVDIAGALNAGNTITGGAINADRISFIIGSGTATATGNFNRVTVDGSTSAGGSVILTEDDDIILDDVTGTQVNVTLNTTGNVTVGGDVNFGSGILNITANNITENVNGSITGSSLGLNATGDVELTTSIATLLDGSAANLDLTNTGALSVGEFTTTGAISIVNSGATTIAGTVTAGTSFLVDSGAALTVNGEVSANTGLDLLANGNIAVNNNVSTVDGDLNIISDTGSFTTAADIDILGDESILIQTLSGGVISIGANNTIVTDAKTTGQGNVSIIQGAAPTKTKKLKGRNITAVTIGDGQVLTGRGKGTKKVIFEAPNNTLTGEGATLLISASTKNGVIVNGGAVITADPPVAAGATVTITTWSPATTSSQAANTTSNVLPASLASIAAPVAVSSVNMMTTANATATTGKDAISTSLSNLATANSLEIFGGQEDDSTIVGYAPVGQVVDGKVCSDIEFGFASNAGGNGVSTIKHSDLVTFNHGHALFVPSKDMTVVTPKGSVKLGANAVAFISVDEHQLSVYDINDQRKGSVVVATGGRDLSLSPGRHLTVTHDRVSSFGDANPIESIMHRSVNTHDLGAGKRAFATEFSIPSAVSVVKPLQAILNSNEANAKRVAARVLKTSAVVMMVGSQMPFEFHTKPRAVALLK